MPPTGAKGLNLAASDIHYLSQALIVVQMAGWVAMIVAAVVATARRGERWLWP